MTDAPSPTGRPLDGRPVLLLDVMDTLVVEPYWDALPAFFGLTFDELVEQKHPTAWIEFELGRLDEEAYLARFFRDGRPVDGPALRAHLTASYRFVDGVEPVLDALSAAGVEAHALSNYPVWYRLIEESLGLSRWLEWSFVSCHTGVRKPDDEAFLGPARRLGVPAERCLLVDDREGNVAAARRLGMGAILFTDAGSLREALAEEGVL